MGISFWVSAALFIYQQFINILCWFYHCQST